MSDVLSGLGLLIGMAGTVAAFFWGFPQPEVGDVLLLQSSPSKAERDRLKRWHRRRSFVGLALLFVAFALQFAGLIAGD